MLNFIKLKEIDLQKLPLSKIVAVGAIISLFFSIRSCHLKELALNDKGLEIKMYENKTQAFTSEINAKNQEVATQKANIIYKDKELEKQLLANSKLKSLVTQIKMESSAAIKNVIANYKPDNYTTVIELPNPNDTTQNPDTIRFDIGDKYVPIGRQFAKVDTGNWYSIYGTIEKQGILIDSLKLKNKFTVNLGQKKVKGIKGIFGKSESVVEVINKNPYVRTDKISNITFKPNPKKFYQTQLFAVGVGIVGGLMVPVITSVLIK